MSIKSKLTMLMIGISLTAVVLTVTGITSYLIYDMREAKVHELEVTAAVTGDRNSAALLFLDNEMAERNLEIFRLNASVLATCIYDLQGVLFSGYHASETGFQCPGSEAGAQLVLPDLLTAFQQISKSGKPIGSIYMVANTSEIDAYIYKIILISGTAVLLVLGVIMMLTLYLQRTISKPILELTTTVQSITASREYDHSLDLCSSQNDETGILVKAFNEMLQEVRKRDFELIKANETLEEKVTERTQELEKAMHKAEQASEAKSEFLRNMSHEFRTPLHAMVSFSTYGSKESETASRPELHRYFEMILKGSQRLNRLVNEVLDLAGMEHGQNKFIMERAGLYELALQAADLVSPLLKDKEISLKIEEPEEQVFVSCDGDKIVQVFTNLLGNAIKFTPNGRNITVQMSVTGSRVVTSVIDQGIGIPEGETDLIFESFQQSSRTNKGAGGTGLGLAICRNILEAHDGNIWAENNQIESGACINFSLPLAGEEQHSIEPEEGTHHVNTNAA